MMLDENTCNEPVQKGTNTGFENTKASIESTIIISLGIWMHLNRISIIELSYTEALNLIPNAASTLFTFTILCALAKLRMTYAKNLTSLRRYTFFMIEIVFILLTCDMLVRQFWIPCLKVLNYLCIISSKRVLTFNKKYSDYYMRNLSMWLQNDGFYIIRFAFSLLLFVIMLEATGIMDTISLVLSKKFNTNFRKYTMLNHTYYNIYVDDIECVEEDDDYSVDSENTSVESEDDSDDSDDSKDNDENDNDHSDDNTTQSSTNTTSESTSSLNENELQHPPPNQLSNTNVSTDVNYKPSISMNGSTKEYFC